MIRLPGTKNIMNTRLERLSDYIYTYWKKLKIHLDKSTEASIFNETSEAYMIVTSPEWLYLYYKSMGLRKNTKFAERLAQTANHMYSNLFDFFTIHEKQNNYYRTYNDNLTDFICKYIYSP